MAARTTKRSRPGAGGGTGPSGRASAPPVEPEIVAAESAAADPPSDPRVSRPPGPAAERRLETILRALAHKELDALIERLGVRVDPKKRIDKPAQLARALVRLPDVREPNRLPSASAELLRRIAEAGGSLLVGSVPAGLELLARRGLVFARMADEDKSERYRRETESEAAPGAAPMIELVVPTAFLVQMKSGEGEDPRSLRALLADAPFETASAIASHYLGRPSTPPIALSLEPAWEVLGDREQLGQEIARISHQERRLLDQLEQVGGEVDTQELMDLEREPMRVRGVYGVAAGRRGAAFSLEKRGFLFPLHPNRYVIPTEVAAVIGADRRSAREARREKIRSHVVAEDHLPRRARFSADPAPFALALAMIARETAGGEVKSGVGTPRSLVARLGQRFGKSADETALIIALSRAVGLWEPGAASAVAPPGSLRVRELTRLLFDTWRRGGAWDEARSEPEMLRVPQEHRDPSPAHVLREIVLDALCDLSEGQWVPYRELVAYCAEDPRIGGLRRLLERWAKRVGSSPPDEAAIAERILLESLPALGALDVGGAAGLGVDGGETRAVELAAVALRLTSRGRELIEAAAAPLAADREQAGTASQAEERLLRVGTAARVGQAMELSPFADVTAIEPALELEISAAAMARGLAQGIDAAEMRRRLSLLGPLSEAVAHSLAEAGTVIGRGTLAAAAGFLWVDDQEVRELLRARPGTAEMFVDPSPPGGLLVAPGVDPERLVRRCRALGVEVGIDETAWRARRSTVPPPKLETSRKTLSWRPPAIGGTPGTSSRD